MKFNLLKKKNESVTEEEIRELISFNNKNINAHLADWDTVIKRLQEQRGGVFSKAIKENSLNKFEALLISGYADFIASDLNRELKYISNKRSNEYMLYEQLLNKSLKKMKAESDATVYVMYQCGDDENKLYSWYENRIGESVQFPNFLSSSRRKWKNFGFYLQIKTAQNSSGKYIGSLTNKEKLEEEVTFMSNTIFEISGVDRDQHTIFLTELPRKYQGNYLLTVLYYLNILNKEEVHMESRLISFNDEDE
jgi:hypothetical protein